MTSGGAFSLTGGSLFNPPKTTGSGFSFGTTNTSKGFGFSNPTTSSFSFGTNQANSNSNFSFGSSLNQSASSSSGYSFGSNASSGGLFGSKPPSSTSLNGGSLFNAPKTPGTGFGFQSGNAFKGFNQNPVSQAQPFQNFIVNQPQHQNIDPNVALYLAVCAPNYFNDERDEVLKKWNQLQAVLGSGGKGYYAQNMPPIEFSPNNPFCRFKAVGYAKLPSQTSEDGLIELCFAKKESEVRLHQQQIVDTLVKIFDGCQVCVDYVRPVSEMSSRMCIYVLQKSPNGETKKIQAGMIYNHLSSQNMKQQVQNLSITSVTPLVSLAENQLKEYLDNPPQGLDPMIWEQGKRASPDSKKFLPVPIIGFNELQSRFKAQEEESGLLQSQLDGVAEGITQLQGKMSKLTSDLQECKRRQVLISHRVLKLVIRQELTRKLGVPIEQREEHLRVLLEALHSQLSSPTQYMGRLNEILSQISVQPNIMGTSTTVKIIDQPRYSLDIDSEKDLQQFLSWEQDAIKQLVEILKEDLDTADKFLLQVAK